MVSRITLEPIGAAHIGELEAVLRNDRVYEFIGGVPSSDRFRLRTERAIAGPPSERASEAWINLAVRLSATGELIGRVEATIHDGLAEVAFLFGPASWGRGLATEGLHALHGQLLRRPQPPAPWATTVPENTRSRALLVRCGYTEVPAHQAPRLYTYDDGDLVFRGPSQALPAV